MERGRRTQNLLIGTGALGTVAEEESSEPAVYPKKGNRSRLKRICLPVSPGVNNYLRRADVNVTPPGPKRTLSASDRRRAGRSRLEDGHLQARALRVGPPARAGRSAVLSVRARGVDAVALLLGRRFRGGEGVRLIPLRDDTPEREPSPSLTLSANRGPPTLGVGSRHGPRYPPLETRSLDDP